MRFLLLPLAILYGIITAVRNKCYDIRLFKITKVSQPVISVGNITAGGTGKTPMTIHLAEQSKLRGFKPGIVSRGYGRHSKGLHIVHDGNEIKTTVEISGDEPILIASLLKDVPVVVSEDRVKGAVALVQNFYVDLIILDDGFQHRKIHRDVDIVLINANEERSAYHMLPVGQLREIPRGLKRAGYVVITKGSLDTMPSIIQKFIGQPILASQFFQTKKYTDSAYEIVEPCEDITSPVFAFCGIAQPNSFFDSLREMDIEIADCESFTDHADYDFKTMAILKSKINASNTKIVLTTEKDLVKLPDSFFEEFSVFVLAMKISIDESSLDSIFSTIKQ